METGSIIIALLFLGVGIVAGVLATMIISWGTKKETSTSDSRAALYRPEAHVWRDRASGRLALELDDQIISSPQALSAEQRQKAEKLAAELTRWLGIQPVQAAPAAGVPVRPAVPPVEVAPVVPAAAPAAHPASGSIVQQINDVLQEQLDGTPLAERAIRLSDGPRQTVVVWVGGQRYEGIDAVPDPEVKAAIRAAVSEWERRAAKNSPSGQ